MSWAGNGQNGNGLQLEKNGLIFSSLLLVLKKWL